MLIQFMIIMYALMGVLTFAMFCLSISTDFARNISNKAKVRLTLYFSVAVACSIAWPISMIVGACLAVRIHISRHKPTQPAKI